MSKWFCPTMAVCEMREITLHGPLPLRTKSGEIILVPEPSSHTGPRSISYRIISSTRREGLVSIISFKFLFRFLFFSVQVQQKKNYLHIYLFIVMVVVT